MQCLIVVCCFGHYNRNAMATSVAAPARRSAARRIVKIISVLLEPKLGANWNRYEWSEPSVALENIVQNQPDRWLSPAYSNFK